MRVNAVACLGTSNINPGSHDGKETKSRKLQVMRIANVSRDAGHDVASLMSARPMYKCFTPITVGLRFTSSLPFPTNVCQ